MTAPPRTPSLFVCPETGAALDNWRSPSGVRYPLVSGIPVLVSEPKAFLLRHGPWDPNLGVPTVQRQPIAIREPDAITPHLPAGALGAPLGLGDWLAAVGSLCPAQVALSQGSELAPPGPVLHLGCGVGDFTRRVAVAGRVVYAVDRSPEAVVLARDLLSGRIRQGWIPTHGGGAAKVRFPHSPVPPGVQFAIADPRRPPFAPGSFAWVHVDRALDGADATRLGEVLVAATAVLARGGTLTLTTAYDGPRAGVPGAPAPEPELRDALVELGLRVVREQLHVPRVTRHYDRSFQVDFHHCVAARRH